MWELKSKKLQVCTNGDVWGFFCCTAEFIQQVWEQAFRAKDECIQFAQQMLIHEFDRQDSKLVEERAHTASLCSNLQLTNGCFNPVQLTHRFSSFFHSLTGGADENGTHSNVETIGTDTNPGIRLVIHSL